MSENDQRGLRRISTEQHLPVGFEQLPEEDRRVILRDLAAKQAEVLVDTTRAVRKSQIAENDLHVHNENVARLDHEKKIYSSKISAETGSGRIDMQVRGGDTRFVVPILVVVGVILLAIITVFALR
ncbi:MAG: hypothetical protein H6818_24190 [Phycisphaerales bacterium]|nr:hypothetical protein [Phycisphaerales bacterium]